MFRWMFVWGVVSFCVKYWEFLWIWVFFECRLWLWCSLCWFWVVVKIMLRMGCLLYLIWLFLLIVYILFGVIVVLLFIVDLWLCDLWMEVEVGYVREVGLRVGWWVVMLVLEEWCCIFGEWLWIFGGCLIFVLWGVFWSIVFIECCWVLMIVCYGLI